VSINISIRLVSKAVVFYVLASRSVNVLLVTAKFDQGISRALRLDGARTRDLYRDSESESRNL
jgi:hypothetical protein